MLLLRQLVWKVGSCSLVICVWCHTESRDLHCIFRHLGGTYARLTGTVDDIIWNYLVQALDLRAIIEILWNLLNALTNHSCRNYILCAHCTSRHDRCSCIGATKRILNQVCWNLRPRSKDFPDFECSFQLDDFDSFHWILVVGCGRLGIFSHDSCNFGYLSACNVAYFATVKRCYIATSSPDIRSLAVSHGLSIRVYLGCAIGSTRSREAFSYERVDIYAKIDPFVASYAWIRDSCVHLISHDTFGTFTQHEPSTRLSKKTTSCSYHWDGMEIWLLIFKEYLHCVCLARAAQSRKIPLMG